MKFRKTKNININKYETIIRRRLVENSILIH